MNKSTPSAATPRGNVLAAAETNAQDFVNTLGGAWREESLLANLNGEEGTISLPRFTMNFSTELNQALTSTGMADAFARDSADFSGITTTENLHISAVTQKACVEVDQNGAEAAAVTAVTIAHPAIAPATRVNSCIDHYPTASTSAD